MPPGQLIPGDLETLVQQHSIKTMLTQPLRQSWCVRREFEHYDRAEPAPLLHQAFRSAAVQRVSIRDQQGETKRAFRAAS